MNHDERRQVGAGRQLHHNLATERALALISMPFAHRMAAFFVACVVISYGALGMVNGVTKFVSSATVGVVWTAISPTLGFGLAALMMAAGTLTLIHPDKASRS